MVTVRLVLWKFPISLKNSKRFKSTDISEVDILKYKTIYKVMDTLLLNFSTFFFYVILMF